MRVSPKLLLPWLLAGLLSSACAQHMSQRATSSALDTFGEKVRQDSPEEQRIAEIVAGRVVDGAMAKLSSPAQLAAIRSITRAASTEAVEAAFDAGFAALRTGNVAQIAGGTAMALEAALTDGMVRDLGPDGHGPLARSLSGAVNAAAVSATEGALGRLMVQCGDDEQCLDKRIAELSRGAAAGFVQGIRDALPAPGPMVALGLGAAFLVAFVVAFVAGITCAALVSVALGRARRTHDAAGHGDHTEWAVKPG
jgi:hypothetical protein